MKAIVPGHYTIMQPYLTGGGQVRLCCWKCWHEFDRELPKLPRPDRHDTLKGKCPQCNTEQVYEPSV